jgi:hypothetical protein
MSQAVAARARAVQAQLPQGESLRIVPILGPSHDTPPYELLRDQTLDRVQISEISEVGSVPILQVHNALDVRVYLMDGQELIGAKQNRILNTDVLIPAGAKLTIPVSCVEQGRWHHVSPHFQHGKTSHATMRARKAGRVHASLRRRGTHDANQAAVWDEVEECLQKAAVVSPTSALAAAYSQHDEKLRDFRAQLELPADAVGVAAFHGSRFCGLDLFDRHATLKYFWESLLDSYAIDLLDEPVDPAFGAKERADVPTPQAIVRAHLERAAAAGNWERFAPPGEGVDWRLDDPQVSGSALVWDERVVIHLQLFPRSEQDDAQGSAASARTTYRPRVRRRYGIRRSGQGDAPAAGGSGSCCQRAAGRMTASRWRWRRNSA